jgi:hypothetical protein
MEFKYNIPTLQRLEAILKANHYIVRYEKGHFTSGYCILKDKKVVVVNKFFSTEARINCLMDIMDQVDIQSELITDEKLLKFFHQLPFKSVSV